MQNTNIFSHEIWYTHSCPPLHYDNILLLFIYRHHRVNTLNLYNRFVYDQIPLKNSHQPQLYRVFNAKLANTSVLTRVSNVDIKHQHVSIVTVSTLAC